MIWIIVVLELLSVYGRYTPDLSYLYSVPPKKIQNYIDHTNTLSGTFTQRYFELITFYNNSKPKAVLYLCGEVTCGLPGPGSLPYMTAERIGATYYAIEHRYYGESQPMSDWSTSNLKYLNPIQALSDIAFFIEHINRELREKYGKVPKWVVISGSYPGALAAWFRYKYPHLVSGAIASSAVINSFLEFPKFEWQFIEDLDKCPGGSKTKILQNYQEYATKQMSSPETKQQFLKIFNVTDMSMLEFAYFFADLPIFPIMLGRLKDVCELLRKQEESNRPIAEQIKQLAEYAKSIFGFTVGLYTFSHLRNTTISFTKFERQWTYQFCSSFGWLQTPSFPRHIRWEGMNLRYWKEYCEAVFDREWMPDTEHINELFGGEEIAKHGSNIFFTQGEEDGWQWAGIRTNVYNNNKIHVAIIKDCAHCADLHTEKDTDPDSLKQIREQEIHIINTWLQ